MLVCYLYIVVIYIHLRASIIEIEYNSRERASNSQRWENMDAKCIQGYK